ncbi:MAG TPA: coenzyme F420-0:L-glutamate ligase, partial [Candidatus Limnocylindria bacterium]
MTQLTVTAVRGLPEIRPGDDLATLIRDAARAEREEIRDGDIVVIAQKIVSKSEGRIVHLADVLPGERARAMAAES